MQRPDRNARRPPPSARPPVRPGVCCSQPAVDVPALSGDPAVSWRARALAKRPSTGDLQPRYLGADDLRAPPPLDALLRPRPRTTDRRGAPRSRCPRSVRGRCSGRRIPSHLAARKVEAGGIEDPQTSRPQHFSALLDHLGSRKVLRSAGSRPPGARRGHGFEAPGASHEAPRLLRSGLASISIGTASGDSTVTPGLRRGCGSRSSVEARERRAGRGVDARDSERHIAA